jgi:phage tail-like protein
MATRRGQESKSYFKILVDDVEVPGFIKVKGLSTETEIIDTRNEKQQLVEKSKGHSWCSNVVLIKKRTRDQPFWNWLKDIQAGKIEKKTITIELVYRNRPLRGWNLINCWPCRWAISDITDDVLDTTEEIELVVEKIDLL